MAYYGPRRKSKLQKACEALDPGVRLLWPPKYVGHYVVYIVVDGAGREIGYSDGSENAPVFAWTRALHELRHRARRAMG